MESGKQIQKAGNNAQQIQASTIIFNQGISEERVRTIFNEMIPIALQNYTSDAYNVANRRINKLEENILPKIDEVEGFLSAFADPSFQILLRKAQQTAAATDREDDYALLSELLASHVEKGNSRKNRAEIEKAVEIIDKIDNDALCALTLIHVIQSSCPVVNSCTKFLWQLNFLFQRLVYCELPTGRDWIDHLDILDAVHISTQWTKKDISEDYTSYLNGCFCTGIKIDSDDYQRAIELLVSIKLDESFLVPNELLDGYVRLPLRNQDQINHLLCSEDDNSERRLLTEDEKNKIRKVWDLYSKDSSLKAQVKSNFMRLWDEYESLHRGKEWWNKIPKNFYITGVGKTIADINAKRCCPDLSNTV